MRNTRIVLIVFGVFFVAVGGVAAVGIGKYNTLQAKDESVKAAWSQVLNVYKRRADLVPNLVNVVKGYATHEQQTFTQVTEARTKATGMNVNINDPQSLQNFQTAQGELQGALSRLLMVSERYPDLKASEQFRDLQVQLEGTENRITVERQRYIAAVQDFNTFIRMFPNNLMAMLFGHPEKPNFSVENEQQLGDAPVVNFAN